MAKTRHIQKRMNQRGIQSHFLDLVKTFGIKTGDKCTLNKKACKDVLAQLDAMRQDIIKMYEQGGLVLVEQDDVEITCYRLNSYKK